MVTKQCSVCKEVKPLSEFHKNKGGKFGVRSMCKVCIGKYHKKYCEDNKELVSERWKNYYNDNREKLSEQRKEFRESNKKMVLERHKRYYENNKEKVCDYSKSHYEANKEKIITRQVEYNKNKRRSDPLYSLKNTIRARMWEALKKNGYSKRSFTHKMLGCTFEELKQHLESQFTEGMSWGNRGEWHIDHIVPLASATNEAEMVELCHYTNLQPLWAEENRKKGAKMLIVGERNKSWQESHF